MATTHSPETGRTDLSFAQILEGKIALDRAIKHLENRRPASIESPEFEAVMLMESFWTKLELQRVRKINSRRHRRVN